MNNYRKWGLVEKEGRSAFVSIKTEEQYFVHKSFSGGYLTVYMKT